MKQHLRKPGYFAPTPMYDKLIVSDFHLGGAWPHYDVEGRWCNCASPQ